MPTSRRKILLRIMFTTEISKMFILRYGVESSIKVLILTIKIILINFKYVSFLRLKWQFLKVGQIKLGLHKI